MGSFSLPAFPSLFFSSSLYSLCLFPLFLYYHGIFFHYLVNSTCWQWACLCAMACARFPLNHTHPQMQTNNGSAVWYYWQMLYDLLRLTADCLKTCYFWVCAQHSIDIFPKRLIKITEHEYYVVNFYFSNYYSFCIWVYYSVSISKHCIFFSFGT